MNIALLGYGKMGKAIEELALYNGHRIVAKIDDAQDKIGFEMIDVAIDFSTPEVAFDNISSALKNKTPIVSGTTGWLERYEEIVKLCKEYDGSFIYASNFSLGVNLFFELNKQLAKLMKGFDYTPSIIETHHTQKIDAPSGTAISLAEEIISHSNKKNWILDKKNETDLSIIAIRKDNITGIHQVTYSSKIDEIEIKHTAKNRLGFAQGALLAAEYILDKKGVFTMKDVLGLKG